MNFWDVIEGVSGFNLKLAKRVVAAMLLVGLCFAPGLLTWMAQQKTQQVTTALMPALQAMTQANQRLVPPPVSVPPAAAPASPLPTGPYWLQQK